MRYTRSEVVTFRKTREAFGGLSNMAGGYPLIVNGTRILTTEAIYQACRFPTLPDLQREIIDDKSPMSAKMRTKPRITETRPDWETARLVVMRWCLELKLSQNPMSFGSLLRSTGDKPIVEDSRKDAFWGAIPNADDTVLEGENMLGQMLMDLRSRLLAGTFKVNYPELPNFLLFGEPIREYRLPPKDETVFDVFG